MNGPSAANAAVGEYASDDEVVSSDDEDDSNYDSDDDSDDDEEENDEDEAGHVAFRMLQLSPQEMHELLDPHAFRTAHGVVYGYWSKCPLG
jgi:hypothetical protein